MQNEPWGLLKLRFDVSNACFCRIHPSSYLPCIQLCLMEPVHWIGPEQVTIPHTVLKETGGPKINPADKGITYKLHESN